MRPEPAPACTETLKLVCRFSCNNPLNSDTLAADVVRWHYELVRDHTDPALLKA